MRSTPTKITIFSLLSCLSISVFLLLSGCGEDKKESIPTGFSWVALPEDASVIRGDQAQILLRISAISGLALPKTASFSVSGLPEGTTGVFLSDKFFLPANVILYIDTASSTPLGTFPLTIKNNQGSETLSITLTVQSLHWDPILPSGNVPAGLSDHTAVYDDNSDQMIVFGGYAPGGLSADVWSLEHVTGSTGTPAWSLHPANGGPTARAGHRAIYDPTENRMIVWGGTDLNQEFVTDRLWVLTHANGVDGTPAWLQLQETGGGVPASRFGFSLVYDSSTNRAILFGGATINGDATTWFNDVWVLTQANGLGGDPSWVDVTPASGNIPNSRMMHTAVYDSAANRMIIFGGNTASGPSNDVWVLSHANGIDGTPTWQPLNVSGNLPTARQGHTAALDAITNQMIVFGGIDKDGTLLDDLWVLEKANGSDIPAQWGSHVTSHTSHIAYPDSRYNHSTIIIPENDTMILFGGLTETGLSNEVWSLLYNPVQ